jgi:hypothetical protein
VFSFINVTLACQHFLKAATDQINSIFQGKVSTPRLEQVVSTVSNVTASLNTTSHKVQQPSLIQEKKSCFGFNDDDTYDECEADVSQASSLGGGYVTLSDISPVKRSSMLPPSHCITLIASPSYSNTSGASDFAKPAKYAKFFTDIL